MLACRNPMRDTAPDISGQTPTGNKCVFETDSQCLSTVTDCIHLCQLQSQIQLFHGSVYISEGRPGLYWHSVS